VTWSGKRVLVTGAGGFIGSHLTEQLLHAGATVRAMVRYNSSEFRGWLATIPTNDRLQILAGDITDPDSVRHAMKDIDIVFHLAALIAIPYSYQAPSSYVNTNILGTLNVLQAARQLNIERLVHTSTSEVYGTACYVPIDEKHPLQGQSPYSASKIGADKLVESYYCSFNLPVVTVRPFNTFGPRQSARAVIPTIITQCLTGQTVRLGSVSPTRDLNFVTNTVDGFMKAAMSPNAIGKTINLGTGREISIGDLANLIGELAGKPFQVETDPNRLRPVNSEVERLLADATLAKQAIGWEPQITLETGLQQTIRWIHDNLERYRPGVYVV
jgi:NAD dependent epimerase/dehydratase